MALPVERGRETTNDNGVIASLGFAERERQETEVERNGIRPVEPAVLADGGPMTMAAAVDQFFADLRLAPRSKKTYWHGIAKFIRHIETIEGLDPKVAPVTAIQPDHVTDFAASLLPPDVRT